jgi:hypothetical protein
MLGHLGRPTRARGKKEKKAAGLGWLRAKREERERDGPAVEKRERRGEIKVFFLFLLNFFSNSFFKHSNFNQTKIHAFES